jgi:hypothetical protein
MIKEQNRVRVFGQVLYLLWYKADKLTGLNSGRTDAYNLKSMALSKKCEHGFAPVLLFNIVAKFRGNRIKRARF